MEFPRNHSGLPGKLSVVFLTTMTAIGLAGGTATQASTQTYSAARNAPSLAKATATPSPTGTAAYSVTDLGSLGGLTTETTQAFAINGNGQIVGESVVHNNSGYHYHAFIYSAGKLTDLGTLPSGDESGARAIDKYGDVAGTANTCKGCYTENAFLYQNGKMKDIGTLGGPCSFAAGMNDLAEVVGEACSTTNQVAFLYSGGKMTNLGTLGGCCSGASDINNSHQVVGGSETSFTFSSSNHAVLWSNGTMTDLGTLGGPDSTAYAINDAGQIVGYASPPNSAVHAFLYQNGTMQDLGSFGDASVAEAINNLGVIVGSADVLGADRAFIYSGGTLQDLNNLIPAGSGVTLTEATGINDKGQIVCNGDNASGYGNAFLLNPT